MKQLTGMFRSDRLGRIYGGQGAGVDDFCRSTDVRINMAAELTAKLSKSNIHLHVHDFQVPENDQQMRFALLIAVQALTEGNDVVVNCMGGVGRTGLFMAVIVGLLKPNVGDPIAFVRENYNEHAVETAAQRDWVSSFVRRNQTFGATLRMLIRRTTKHRRQKNLLQQAA